MQDGNPPGHAMLPDSRAPPCMHWCHVAAVVLPFTPPATCHSRLPANQLLVYSCREYVLSFAIMDEGSSFFSEANAVRFLPKAVTSNATALEELLADPGFQESNLMHSING